MKGNRYTGLSSLYPIILLNSSHLRELIHGVLGYYLKLYLLFTEHLNQYISFSFYNEITDYEILEEKKHQQHTTLFKNKNVRIKKNK